jgi:Fe(3+) dicitrate transport protein
MDCFMFNPKLKPVFLAVLGVIASTSSVYAADKEAAKTEIKLDKVVVNGILPEKLEAVPGSFDIVDEKRINERRPFSIKEALADVPGLNVVTSEDPLGLALNIGIRGMDPRRSSRTLLMEDGMSIFLAPYGDPSAHYSTPMEMIDRIEVVKGSGQILYGPQTVGGMINFVTKPVPRNGFAGSITGAVGNNDYKSGHISLGTGNERGGFMFDVLNRKGDGVRDNHKFNVEMYTLKGEVKLTDSQSLIGKLSRYQERSNVSETGLPTAEYNADPFQAPTGDFDKFRHERTAFQLKHIFDINPDMKLSTQAYSGYSNRASRRMLESDDGNGGILTGRSLLGGDEPGTLAADATAANLANAGGAWRPRQYKVWGIEPRLDFKHKLFGIDSDAVIGFRHHEEDITRRKYEFDSGLLGLNDAIRTGEFDERIKHKISAQSYYAQNTFYVGNWSITPGLRFEDLRIKQHVTEGTDAPVSGSRSQRELLPGLGLAWNGIANTTIFTGVHRGFAPPRPDRDLVNGALDRTTPELSTNYELGFRSKYFNGINLSSTLFYTDFEDIVVRGANGSFDNAGEAKMAGLEVAGRVDFGTIYNTPHNFYVTGSYTNLFTAKLKKDMLDTGDFGGGASSGARLAYAPKNMASLNFGYAHPVGINARIGADYVSEQQADLWTRNNPVDGDGNPVGSNTGLLGNVPSYTLVNASVNFKPVDSKITYFVSGTNLGDREFLASRVDGMAIGRPRQVFGGVKVDF